MIFCNVTGYQEGRFTQWSNARKIYSQTIGGRTSDAPIQVTTAAGVCGASICTSPACLPRSGFVRQEQIDSAQFVHNRFGRYYDNRITTRYSGGTIREAPRIGEGEPAHDQPDTLRFSIG